MNSAALINQAKSFYNAYIALEQLNAACPIPFAYTVPMIVNGAFSIELCLKALLVKSDISYEKEHNLSILFMLLPKNYQCESLSYLVEKAPEYNDPKKLFDELSLISSAFVDWRYCFERQAPAVEQRFISAFANAAFCGLLSHYNAELVDVTGCEDCSEAEIEVKFANNRATCIEKNVTYISKKSSKAVNKPDI